MELLTNRYRNLSVLALAVVGQLLLLGYQVRSRQDVRLVRVWAVTALTETSSALAAAGGAVGSLYRNYVWLVGVRQENERLSKELADLKLEAQRLRADLGTADRAQALTLFQSRSASRTIAARIIGAGTVTDSRVVFLDVGANQGVADGMGVITPDGLVGRVRAAYPTTAQVVLLTDPSFAAGVISQKHHVQGALKGNGSALCRVDYVHNEEKLDQGEWFFTSGDDRLFPRGLPVGVAEVVQKGKALKDILVSPSGLRNGLEEVLVVLEPVHQPVPDAKEPPPELRLLPLPPDEMTVKEPPAGSRPAGAGTDADGLLERYRRIGEAQGHVYGQGAPGSRPPDFNIAPANSPATPAKPPATPPANGPDVTPLQ
ncbi:MAG: rod shape-determining protein MreC [Bryobacteraceae bacterium]|nr:rod shape-determining protein MreC [Bryobacteraceae bacterium]